MVWSKSPEAIAKRSARPQLLHYVAPGQPWGQRRTACGRLDVPNGTMWICSQPDKATCPRCVSATERA